MTYYQYLQIVSEHVNDDGDALTDTDGELVRGQGRKLSDYHLVHGSTITICMRVKGGSDRPTRLPGLIDVTYDQPDMISLDDSRSPRAVMPCGHVISEYGFSFDSSVLPSQPTNV